MHLKKKKNNFGCQFMILDCVKKLLPFWPFSHSVWVEMGLSLVCEAKVREKLNLALVREKKT